MDYLLQRQPLLMVEESADVNAIYLRSSLRPSMLPLPPLVLHLVLRLMLALQPLLKHLLVDDNVLVVPRPSMLLLFPLAIQMVLRLMLLLQPLLQTRTLEVRQRKLSLLQMLFQAKPLIMILRSGATVITPTTHQPRQNLHNQLTLSRSGRRPRRCVAVPVLLQPVEVEQRNEQPQLVLNLHQHLLPTQIPIELLLPILPLPPRRLPTHTTKLRLLQLRIRPATTTPR
mmetsp:Transcript_14372/g.19216  ORF Transcript_14372/g.19216 Transcript_14372/m.19216 type:complete len:228 (-) Transcript_14372:1542-2225(-)